MSPKKPKNTEEDLLDETEVKKKRSFMEDPEDHEGDEDPEDTQDSEDESLEDDEEDEDGDDFDDLDEMDDEDMEEGARGKSAKRGFSSDDEDLDHDHDEEGSSAEKSRSKMLEEEEDEDPIIPLSDEDRLKNEIRDLAEKINDEVIHLQENFDIEEIRKVIQEIDFFNTNQSDECVEKYCENLQTTMGHCRYHYIKNWKKLKKKRAILKEGKLQEYIEELITKYPTKYIEAIMQDIQGEKQFFNVLKDLNIDSHYNVDDPDSDLDAEDDLHVDARNLTGSRMHFDDDDIL